MSINQSDCDNDRGVQRLSVGWVTKQKDDNVFISQLYLVVALRYSPPPPKGEPMAKVQPVPRTMGGHT